MDGEQQLPLAWTIEDALDALYRDLLWVLEDLVDRGGTAEGAARVLKAVAKRHGVRSADSPLPRPSRRTRERLAVERQAAR